MEILETRIKEINQELIELSELKAGLEGQLKAIDLRITQKVGAIEELKAVLEQYLSSLAVDG